MTNKIWRWIKKAFIVNLLTAIITYIVLIFVGIASLFTLIEWIKANPLLFILGYALIHLMIEGFLIEWVNKQKFAN